MRSPATAASDRLRLAAAGLCLLAAGCASAAPKPAPPVATAPPPAPAASAAVSPASALRSGIVAVRVSGEGVDGYFRACDALADMVGLGVKG